MSTIGISIIIPTFNRLNHLDKTLHSAVNQNFPNNKYQIIVVDDGSSEDTLALIHQYSKKSDVEILYVYQKDQGFRAARARNLGIALARFEICLFIDNGVVFGNELLNTHWKIYSDNPEDTAVIGFANGMQEYHSKTLTNGFDIKEPDVRLQKCQFLAGCSNEALFCPWLLFWTCHVSVKRVLLNEVGLFDENFNSWGGEDVELAIRLHKIGTVFKLNLYEDVYHLPHPKNSQTCQTSSQENIHYIKSKHPEVEYSHSFDSDWSELVRDGHCMQVPLLSTLNNDKKII